MRWGSPSPTPPEVWGRQHAPFLAARAALAAGEGDAGKAKATDAVMSIKKGIILTFARATIKSRMSESEG